MKLYATITSERATKGQGGKYLDIVVKDDNKQIAMIINVIPYDDSIGTGLKAIITLANHVYARVIGEQVMDVVRESKGKKQKDEMCTDGLPHRLNEEGDCTGEDCHKQITE